MMEIIKIINKKRTTNNLQLTIGVLMLILLNNEKLEIITTLTGVRESLLGISAILIASGIGILPLGLIGELISFTMVLTITNILAKFSTSGNNIVEFGSVIFKYKLSLQEKKEYADSLLKLNANSPKIDANYNKILRESESYVEIKEKVINWLLKKQEKSSIFDYLTNNEDMKFWLIVGAIAVVGISYLAIHYYYLSETTIAQGETLNSIDRTLIEQGNLNNDTIQVSQSLANTIKELGAGLQKQIDIIMQQLAAYKGKQDLLIQSAEQNSQGLTEVENNLLSMYNLMALLRKALASKFAIELPEIPEDVPEVPGKMIFLGLMTCKNYITYRNMHKSVTQTIDSPALLLKLRASEGQTLVEKLKVMTEKQTNRKELINQIKEKQVNKEIEDLKPLVEKTLSTLDEIIPENVKRISDSLHQQEIQNQKVNILIEQTHNVNKIANEKLSIFKSLHKRYSQLYDWAIANPGLALALGISTTALIAYLIKYGKKGDALVIAAPVESIAPTIPTTNVTLLHFSPTLGITLPDIIPKSLRGLTRKYSTSKEVYNTKVKLVYYSDIVQVLSKEDRIAIKKNKKIAIDFLNFHLPLIEKCEKIEINENEELVIIFQLNNKNYGTALINTYAYANLINSLEKELKLYFRLRKKDFLTFFNEHLKICKENMNRTPTFLDIIILTREEELKKQPYRDTSYSSFKLIELDYSGDLSLSDIDLSVNQQLSPITHNVMENFENLLKIWKKK